MTEPIEITPDHVRATRQWILERDAPIVSLINRVRDDLGDAFEVDVASVDRDAFETEVHAVFDDGDLAVNVTGLISLLRAIDVADDYPGFIVDELLGRRLAGMLAEGQPHQLLAEATFHYVDATHHHEGDERAGDDDLEAALAAGFQTRLSGWPWTDRPSPF